MEELDPMIKMLLVGAGAGFFVGLIVGIVAGSLATIRGSADRAPALPPTPKPIKNFADVLKSK